jgi:BioD-like phosphotransacetylase family protein
MTTVKAIESEIKKLSPEALTELRRWFLKFDTDAWDAQIEADAQSGKPDVLAEEVLAEYSDNKAQVEEVDISHHLTPAPQTRHQSRRPTSLSNSGLTSCS